MLPITESANSITTNIDIAEPNEIIRLLFESESQIFGGFDNYEGIFESSIVSKVVNISKSIKIASENISLKSKLNIILAGAGTSGRICRLMAELNNSIVSNLGIEIIPIVSGGIKSLVKTPPNIEDDFHAGMQDFDMYMRDNDVSRCVVIGVSCGLSANYVRGVVEGGLRSNQLTHAILGFNRIEDAKISLEEWLIEKGSLSIINPIVGPEAIVGSVRMKSGTATIILLQSIFHCLTLTDISEYAVIEFFKNISHEISVLSRQNTGDIASIAKETSTCLRKGGDLIYMGSELLGKLCVFDAAECISTFGVLPKEVSAYIYEGWKGLSYFNFESKMDYDDTISFQQFEIRRASQLKAEDLICIFSNARLLQLHQHIWQKYRTSCNILIVLIDSEDALNNLKIEFHQEIRVHKLIIQSTTKTFFSMLSRILLVYISTGAFILTGKIYENKMIDLKISNQKLFRRATRLVSEIANVSTDVAELSIRKTIESCQISVQKKFTSIQDYIEEAYNIQHVVPKSSVMCLFPEKDMEQIDIEISREPILRKLISSYINS